MLSRRPTSEDQRVYLACFDVEEARGGRGVYIDGTYTSRGFVSEDESELKKRLEILIEEGRLSLDAKATLKPDIVSVERRDDLINIRLKGPSVERPKMRPIPFRIAKRREKRMYPVLGFNVAREFREMLEKDRFYDFVELLESFTPLIEEREVTSFDGKTVHPVSARTIISEMAVYSKGLKPRHKREARTAILLDRSVSMANPWALWEEYQKLKVGRFIAKVVDVVQYNNALYSFGVDLRHEESLDDIEPGDEETRLDLALGEVALLEPERLVVITDGKPVYSPGHDNEKLCDSAVELLDAISRSGVRVLAVLLGYDFDMVRFYQKLERNPSVTVIELAAGNDILDMMHKLSNWL